MADSSTRGPRKSEPEITPAVAREHGLSVEEFARIHEILGRAPSYTELGVFSVMWSEHCSYKSSRRHLRGLPTTGPCVIQGPGENAGVVDIGDGQAVVFKMESHNHPSFIEPYQGAATGVGGICRDVFTMGARPIALADCLRFGRADHPRTRTLVQGVVAGIGGYGNSFGVPTVAGDIAFDECYDGNILVNAFCLGLARADRIFLGRAAGIGNPVLYVGAKTGRDGIHGATMASAEFGAGTEEKRPTVQVGDPFMEKLLLEACLELMSSDCLVGIQDMGAAGLTSSSVEMAARAENGVELWLERVPARETGMTPYELMLSESQERMLMVVEAGRESEALAVFSKWDLDAAVIGIVTDTGRVVVKMDGELYADMPSMPLAEGLVYERPMSRPVWLDALQAQDPREAPVPADLGAALLAVLGAPGVASKAWAFSQYDHNVRHGTVVRPGQGDAGVVRVFSPDGAREKGIAITAGCNSRFVYLDPFEGAQLAIAEAVANLSAVGAEPLAVTDCLNFGNPERPEIMWQFAEAVRGLGDACRAFGTPIVSGNVSLYNETEGRGIHPTPMIGMVGLMSDASLAMTQGFRGADDVVVLLGVNTDELGGSEYQKTVLGQLSGRPPRLDLGRARAAGGAVRRMIGERLLRSAHDLSDGGLAIALAECCLTGGEPVGLVARIDPAGLRPDHLLFGEAPARYVLSLAEESLARVVALAAEACVPCAILGRTGGDRLALDIGAAHVELPLAAMAHAFHTGFSRVAD